jgi:lycopene cyclase domain-containing protein
MGYLIILLAIALITALLEWKYHIHLYHSRKERIIITLIFFVMGVAWDSYEMFMGHWIYPGPGTLGITIGFIPLEDYLFVLIVPYMVLTLYKILDRKIK